MNEEDATSAGPPASFLDAAKALLAELPALFSDRVQLLALELKRASVALGQIVALLAAAAIFAATAWAALWAGLVVLLLRAGMPLGYVLLTVLVVNLVAASLALLGIKKLSRWLTLPATVRRLTLPAVATTPAPSPTATPSTEPSHEQQSR